MNQHGPKLAGTSKGLPMGVSMLSFSSFHSRFSERAEFPCRGRICEKELSRWEAAWENLLVNAEQKQREWSSLEERRGDFLRHDFRDPFPPAFLWNGLPNGNGP